MNQCWHWLLYLFLFYLSLWKSSYFATTQQTIYLAHLFSFNLNLFAEHLIEMYVVRMWKRNTITENSSAYFLYKALKYFEPITLNLNNFSKYTYKSLYTFALYFSADLYIRYRFIVCSQAFRAIALLFYRKCLFVCAVKLVYFVHVKKNEQKRLWKEKRRQHIV